MKGESKLKILKIHGEKHKNKITLIQKHKRYVNAPLTVSRSGGREGGGCKKNATSAKENYKSVKIQNLKNTKNTKLLLQAGKQAGRE